MIFNYISILILTALLVKIALFAIKRNKRIVIAGKEENFIVLALLFLSFFIIPIETHIGPLPAIRNALFYLLLFSTYFIKRGVSECGFEKFFMTIKWQDIRCVFVERYLINSVAVRAISGDKAYSLIFKQFKLNEVLAYISKRVTDIKVDSRINVHP